MMAARPRNKQQINLPEHLYYDARWGTYRIKLVSGKFKSLGSDRDAAVSIAREYNLIARPRIGMKVDDLLSGNNGSMLGEPAFSEHISALLKRIIEDERPSADLVKTMENDAQRCQFFFANIPSSQITLQHVNDYITQYHSTSSANVQNRKVSWLKKLFSYAADESIMPSNPASNKKMRRVKSKQRQRLKMEWFMAIHSVAPLWLQTAMDLSLQTTHARLEISRIQYALKKPNSKSCGCYWFDTPQVTPYGNVFGTLYIHRQKVEGKEAAHVAIPIGDELKRIIDRSRDKIVSSYVVHRLPTKRSNGLSKEVNHISQLSPDYISRAFSALRDEVGCCNHLEAAERPTFHEIRALAAHLFDIQGIDPQSRMAHTDAKSTKIYTQNHVEWVEVPFAEIKMMA
ncbi:phage integrase Arm DNA-binding domain-containing protein [Shewanella baltica]|uniref:phage integrase Arm DNA-binding domain-containing protein n=1 Tax=Shewanella baltica TaxID=62322 RepID=UPI00217EAF0A|nr:phage integrase Arm DNA-binding domain-containing protein [Shewanella baltica]